MDPSKLRKQQIANRLGVSVQVLDQYLQSKRAEVAPVRTPETKTPPFRIVGGKGRSEATP